jgi:hypothetical protein
MEQIKNYFKSWGATRIIRLVLAGMLCIAYYYNHESLFLFGGIVLSLQATFNITCPGGSCSTNIRKDDKTTVKTEKYVPNK